MKIAHVVPFFYPEIGGMENTVLNQCRQLVKMGNEVHVYTCNRFRNGNKIGRKEGILDGIVLHYLNSFFHIEKAHFFPSLFQKLLDEDFDIIHTHAIHHPHNDIAAFAGEIKKKNIVFTSHSSFFPKDAVPLYQHYLFFVYDALAKFSIFRRADRIIALTPYDRRELMRRGVNEDKIRIVPNGVEDQYFERRDSDFFRKKYGLDGKIILNVGRLNRIKRLDVPIRALPSILKENPDTTLILIGQDEGYFEYLKNLSKRLGVSENVKWLGCLSEDEKISAYSSCDIFCLPSDSEPFGIVLLEAQASGKPIVASRSGGVPYVVKNGKTGMLVPPNNPHRFADVVNTLFGDVQLMHEMGKNAKEWALNFEWRRVSSQIFSVYKELVS